MNKENLMEKYTKLNSNDVEIRFYKDNLDSIKKYYCIGQPKKSFLHKRIDKSHTHFNKIQLQV